MVIGLAGRRIDADDAESKRFPLSNRKKAEQSLKELMYAERVTELVCSAACGADLLALGVAGALGVQRRVVLPSPPEKFRESSVTDRPGDWGPMFDSIIRELEREEGLLVLTREAAGDDPYAAANSAILDEAEKLAARKHEKPTAVLVWDGRSRGEHDLTEAFGEEARRRGLRVLTVETL